MTEVCWPAAAKTTPSVWSCLSEALPCCCPRVPAQSFQHLRMYVKLETPGSTNEGIRCISFVSLQSMLGRKERAEFSNHYYPRTWLHSPNIIYTHGFLPSAISENVFEATKVNNTNGKFVFRRLHRELLKVRRTAPIKISALKKKLNTQFMHSSFVKFKHTNFDISEH